MQTEPLNLTVTIDPKSGFCFGVVYAIQMAENILNKGQQLYCLGDIVHNDEEVKRLEQKGLKTINRHQLKKLKGGKVLIRAHGEPPETYKIAYENDIELLDASCPVVLKLQDHVRNGAQRKYPLYIYGKPKHPEIVGLLGQVQGKATVFENIKDLNIKTMPRQISLYSQTTKSIDAYYRIIQQLQHEGIEVKAQDTICRQVANREKELRIFVKQFDKIVFVSGTKSSNGRILYQVCLNTNPNSYCIASLNAIQNKWFAKNDKVGICGATSTPQWLMTQVKNHLLKI